MSEKIKNEKLQYPLKVDKVKEELLYNVLSLSENKADFIKDALFYYIHKIELGEVINRHYPYNKLNIRLDIKPPEYEESSNSYETSNKILATYTEYEEYEEEDEYEEDDYSDENEDIEL